VKHCGTLESQPATDPQHHVLLTMCRKEGTGKLSNDGIVFALDMQKGTLLWNIAGAGGVPIYLPESNAVIVAGENGTAFAVDATTSCVIWEQQGILPLARFMGPFVYDPQRGLVYGANFNGIVVALDAKTGEIVWTYKLQTAVTPLIPVPLGPRISPDYALLYFGAYDGALHALKLD
jgi:outer membrane protein assembly factor BamB